MWFPVSVDTSFSSVLEGWVCPEPANWLTELDQEYFFVRLSRCSHFPLYWWLNVLLSYVLGQNNPRWLVTLASFRRRSLQVNNCSKFDFSFVFIKGVLQNLREIRIIIRFVTCRSFFWLQLYRWKRAYSFNIPLEHTLGKPRLQTRVSSCNLLWRLGSLWLVKAWLWFTS